MNTVDWLQIPIPTTKEQTLLYLGEKCDSHEDGCFCCDGWKEWETTGFVTVLVDTPEFLQWLFATN